MKPRRSSLLKELLAILMVIVAMLSLFHDSFIMDLWVAGPIERLIIICVIVVIVIFAMLLGLVDERRRRRR